MYKPSCEDMMDYNGYNGGIEWMYHQTFKNFGLSKKWE